MDFDISKLKVLDDRLLILVNKEEEKKMTAGGLVIPTKPDNPKEKKEFAVIIKIGSKCFDNGLSETFPEFKEGDLVIFDKYAGVSIKINEQFYIIIKKDDILAVIEK